MIATHATATLSHHAYEFIADKVYEPSRIRLGDDQQALVSGRRAKRLRHLPLDSYDASCAYRESTRGTEEIDQLVDCISTNHTHFFREIEQPNFLRDVALPEWVPRLTRERATFKFWSAASSSGEEPYTVALVLAEYARGPWLLALADRGFGHLLPHPGRLRGRPPHDFPRSRQRPGDRGLIEF